VCTHQRQTATPARRLILISAYTIGKERLFLSIFRRCATPLVVTASKLEVLRLLDWPLDAPCDRVFTTNPSLSRVHVVGMSWLGETWPFFRPNYANMELTAQQYVITRP
jgi:DNA ligase 1